MDNFRIDILDEQKVDKMTVFSLEDLCLNAIVVNFDAFHSAYVHSKNAVMVNSIEFLRRMYSDTILCFLGKRGRLKEKYADFIVNRYIKELNMSMLSEFSPEAVINQISEIGSGLQKLVSCEDSGAWLHTSPFILLRHLPNLKVLQLEKVCTDEILLLISIYCPNLVVLNINYSNNVSDTGFKYLVNGTELFTSLKELHIRSVIISDCMFTFILENFPSLEVIEHNELYTILYSLHKGLETNILSQTTIYNLTELRVCLRRNSGVCYNIMTVCSAVCPHVEDLTLDVRDPKMLDLCFKFSKVQRLSIKGTGDINSFLQNQRFNLTSMKIIGFNLSVSALAQGCPHVKELSLDAVDFQEFDANAIFCFKNLKKLSFYNVQWTTNNSKSNYISCLKSMLLSSPVLEQLNFDHCNMFYKEIGDDFLFKLPSQSFKFVNFISLYGERSVFKDVSDLFPSIDFYVKHCIDVSSKGVVFLCNVFDPTTKNKLWLRFFDYKNELSISDDESSNDEMDIPFFSDSDDDSVDMDL